MSCDLRSKILFSLRQKAIGKLEEAKANVEIYLHNPAGIGEHPDVLAAIESQVSVIAAQEEFIEVLDKHFREHKHTPFTFSSDTISFGSANDKFGTGGTDYLSF